jgi:hypothetical protein
MTDERYQELMKADDLPLTKEEMAEGWHWCLEFDGLLRNNNEDTYKCDCLEGK